MAKEHLTISLTERPDPSGREYLSLELDDDKNGDVSTFPKGTTVWVRCFSSDISSALNLFSSAGNATKTHSNVPYMIEEEWVLFSDENQGQLQYEPREAVSYEWVGQDHGDLSFDGRIVSLPDSVQVGVLKISYITYFDRIKVTSNIAGKLLLAAIRGGLDTTLTIEYYDPDLEDETGADKTAAGYYTLVVKDYCSDDVLPDVQVTLDGDIIGTTDENGELSMPSLQPGQEYDIKMTKTDYQDSDADNLDNDSFTVS